MAGSPVHTGSKILQLMSVAGRRWTRVGKWWSRAPLTARSLTRKSGAMMLPIVLLNVSSERETEMVISGVIVASSSWRLLLRDRLDAQRWMEERSAGRSLDSARERGREDEEMRDGREL